jgi:hypothetical protein
MNDDEIEVPLHGLILLPGEWWACSEPERPGDLRTIYDDRCGKCDLKKAADDLLEPFYPVIKPDELVARVHAQFG